MRRVYSEGVPLGALVDAPVLEALARRSIQLLAAVRPGEEALAATLGERARGLGLSLGLWPMLGDAEGRWLGPENAPAYGAFVEGVLAAAGALDTMVLDLEPPIAEVRALVDGRLGAARAWLAREPSREVHDALVGALAARGVESFAAVVPLTLYEGRAGRGWQRALGTPVDGVAYAKVSPMLYTTLFEGYGFGVVRRDDARDLLRRYAALAVLRLGSRASISLGAVGPGALGDERTYRAPEELVEDVAIALGAGARDLTLFDLAGVLARPPIERWLDALCGLDAAAPPPVTARAIAIDAAARATGVALAVAGRLATSS
ncbi:MAG: hypothetical protein KF729_13400 [Sandaracinaceae bacterium]|nr:hypothetical protein [Sandaracinaceae bacterium]